MRKERNGKRSILEDLRFRDRTNEKAEDKQKTDEIEAEKRKPND